MDGLAHLDAAIKELRAARLLRGALPPAPPGALVLCSNDYLGLAAEALTPPDGAVQRGGAGASRLLSGEHAAHTALERAIADWLELPAALVFTSGYAANVGTISALCERGDAIVSDQLNHASIIDGCRLSRASVSVYPHCDVQACARALHAQRSARHRWVITESYFSMDGDSPDLVALADACRAEGAALVVDEAHALGVLGPQGRGLCAAAGLRPDVLIGTLSKAVGGQGGFVAGSRTLRTWLFNRARSFVFSTGLSPALAEGLVERIARVRQADAERTRLAATTARLRAALRGAGAPLASSYGAIMPWMTGEAAAAIELSGWLLAHDLLVPPIRPPTVAPGKARLRITSSAGLTDAELDRAVDALVAGAQR